MCCMLRYSLLEPLMFLYILLYTSQDFDCFVFFLPWAISWSVSALGNPEKVMLCSSQRRVTVQTNHLAYFLFYGSGFPMHRILWDSPHCVCRLLGPPHCLEGSEDWCNSADTLVSPAAAAGKVLHLWLKSPASASMELQQAYLSTCMFFFCCWKLSFFCDVKFIEVGPKS